VYIHQISGGIGHGFGKSGSFFRKKRYILHISCFT